MERHDLSKFDGWVSERDWPDARCPTCRDGVVRPEQIVAVSDARTRRMRGHEDWEPDWITGVFHGSLMCSAAACQERVAVSGDYKVEPVMVGRHTWQGDYADVYRLRFARPALAIIVPPVSTPATVATALVGISELIWLDPNAAANRLRVALEELLNARKIRKFPPGKRTGRPLNAHQRIYELNVRHPTVVDVLEAVKWLGNSGSHESTLSVADVLQGAALFDLALRLLYDTTDRDLERAARLINRAKGVPRPRRTSTSP